jgi:hypothetical protein
MTQVSLAGEQAVKNSGGTAGRQCLKNTPFGF